MCGHNEPCIEWTCTLAPPGDYNWTVCAWRRCGLLSDYCGSLLIFLSLSTLLTLLASSVERLCNGTVSVRPSVRLSVCGRAGRNDERPVRVLDVDARPSPLRTPGRVKLSALVNVTADLPTGLNADVLVSKSLLGLHLKIPCYRNIGSWYVYQTSLCQSKISNVARIAELLRSPARRHSRVTELCQETTDDKGMFYNVDGRRAETRMIGCQHRVVVCSVPFAAPCE